MRVEQRNKNTQRRGNGTGKGVCAEGGREREKDY